MHTRSVSFYCCPFSIKTYGKTIAIFAFLFGYLLQLFACGASAVVWPFPVLSRFRPGSSMSVLGMTRKIGTPTYVCQGHKYQMAITDKIYSLRDSFP